MSGVVDMGRRKKRAETTSNVIVPVSTADVLANQPIAQSVVDATIEQLQIFMVARAREELIRVIELTKTLDKIQDKYQQKINEYIETHDDEKMLSTLPMMIDTITRSLEYSYKLIKDVMGNDKLMTFQVVQNNIEVGNSNSTVVANLEDPLARDRVRRAVTQIINSLPNATGVQDAE